MEDMELSLRHELTKGNEERKSKENKKGGKKRRKPIRKGRQWIQPKVNNWSNLNRGKEARSQKKRNKKIEGKEKPKKKIKNKVEWKNILLYSPRKKKAKEIPAYSLWKPETSSDSASWKSIGARLVSAIIQRRKRREIGNKGKKRGEEEIWEERIGRRSRSPTERRRVKRIRLRQTE